MLFGFIVVQNKLFLDMNQFHLFDMKNFELLLSYFAAYNK